MGFRAAMLAGVGRPVLRFAIEAVRGLDDGAAAGDASTCEVRLLPDVVGPTALHQPASDWLPVEDAWAILPSASSSEASLAASDQSQSCPAAESFLGQKAHSNRSSRSKNRQHRCSSPLSLKHSTPVGCWHLNRLAPKQLLLIPEFSYPYRTSPTILLLPWALCRSLFSSTLRCAQPISANPQSLTHATPTLGTTDALMFSSLNRPAGQQSVFGGGSTGMFGSLGNTNVSIRCLTLDTLEGRRRGMEHADANVQQQQQLQLQQQQQLQQLQQQQQQPAQVLGQQQPNANPQLGGSLWQPGSGATSCTFTRIRSDSASRRSRCERQRWGLLTCPQTRSRSPSR